MGRKATPTVLKLVRGNPGRRPMLPNEAKIPPAHPSCPPLLNNDAKEEWERICAMLYRTGLMTEVDRAALAAYCQAYGVWMQAERAIIRVAAGDEIKGLLMQTKRGNVIQHTLLGIANKARADTVRYATEFGMTPSARARVNAFPPVDGEATAGIEKYFA